MADYDKLCTNMSITDTSHLTELEPVCIDNTEVKVPMADRPGTADNNRDDLYVLEPNRPAQDFSSGNGQGQDLDVYYTCDPEDDLSVCGLSDSQLQQLSVYFHGFPRVMFKDALIKLYAGCDKKLGEVRSDLFVLIGKQDGNPYPGAALKRRMQTRNGDTLAEKLAFDIHTLISILEGGDFSSPEFKELLSISIKGRASSVPHQHSIGRLGTPTTPRRATPHTSSVLRRPELIDLSESITELKADMLNMKQLYQANEAARST